MMYEKNKQGENAAAAGGAAKKRVFGAAGARQLAALCRENLHYSIGVLLLGLVVMLFNYPLNLALVLSSARKNAELGAVQTTAEQLVAEGGNSSAFLLEKAAKLQERMTQLANANLSGRSTLIPLIVIAAAMICGYVFFKYLFSRPQTDFYHSSPVSRPVRFWANYLSGILIMLICFAAGLIGSVLVAAGFGVTGLLIGKTLLINAGYLLLFLLCYTVTVLCMLLTGLQSGAVVAVLCAYGFGPLLSLGIMMWQESCFKTYYGSEGTFAEGLLHLSPAYVIERYAAHIQEMMRVPAGMSAWQPVQMLMIGTLIACAALLLLSFVLFLKRPSEAVSKTLAFAWMKRPVRIVLSVTGGFMMALLGVAYDSTPWMLFFLIAGVLLSHAVLEVFIYMDVRAMFRNKRELVLCLMLAFAAAGVFRWDALGYDRYVPAADKLDAVAVSINGYFDERRAIVDAKYELAENDGTYSESYWDNYPNLLSDMNLREPEVIEAVRGMALAAVEGQEGGAASPADEVLMTLENGAEESGAAEQEAAQDQTAERDVDADSDVYLYVAYKLKSGRVAKRRYMVPRAAVKRYMPTVFASEEYKSVMYPILNLSEEELGVFALEYAYPAGATKAQTAKTLTEQWGGDALEKRMAENYVSAYQYTSNGSALTNVIALSGNRNLETALLKALQQDLREMRFEDYEDWWEERSILSGNEDSDRQLLKYDLLYYMPEEAVEQCRRDQAAYGYTRSGGLYDYYPMFDSFTHVKAVLAQYGLE